MRALAIGLIVWGILGIVVVGLCAAVGEEPPEIQGASVDVLLQQGPALVAAGNYKRVLNMIEDVPEQARNDIRIRTLECFANLKGWVSAKDPVCKTDWWGLRLKLMYVGDSEATPLLVMFLKDEDPYMRKYAAELLGYVGDERALDVLSAAKEKDDNSGVRKYAQWAYQQISGGLTPVTSGLPPLAAPRIQIPVTMEAAGPIATNKRISFVNSTTEFKVVLLAAIGYKKYYADFESWADIIIAQLEVELQKRGVNVMIAAGTAANKVTGSRKEIVGTQEAQATPESDYTFTVAVGDVKLIQGSWATRCVVTVLVERADGQWSHTYEGNNASPASAERAIDGAGYRVVEAIIADPDFRDLISR
jgi:hypothetical protein